VEPAEGRLEFLAYMIDEDHNNESIQVIFWFSYSQLFVGGLKLINNTFWKIARIHKFLEIVCKCPLLNQTLSLSTKPKPQCPIILK
jgi:hypothetical protein